MSGPGPAPIIGVALAALLLSGCLGGLASPRVLLETEGAQRGGEQCGSTVWRPETGESCHAVRVKMENRHARRDAETHSLWWSAQDRDGGVWDAKDAQGPDRVAPGGTATVVVLYIVPTETTLAEVRYGHRFSERAASASIPTY